MALFTDGAVTSIEDLRGHDTQLLNVATVEGIDVTRKLGLAQEEICIEVAGLLGQMRTPTGIYEVSGLLGGLSASPAMEQVVVTPPLKLWHVFRTLEMVYGDAYNSQLNDRYAGRRDQFRSMAQDARERLMEIGIGVASRPVAKAAMALVTPIPAGMLAAGTYFVTVAWVNGAGEEGASANAAMVTVAGGGLEITPGEAPEGVVGWNVYAGPDEGSMVLQNAVAIAAGEAWVQAAAPISSGRKAGAGQAPNYLKPLPRVIPRG
jgi:hypothetical protein